MPGAGGKIIQTEKPFLYSVFFSQFIDIWLICDIFIRNMLTTTILRGTGTTGTGTSPLRAEAVGALVMDA
jgi:hypothetical protein